MKRALITGVGGQDGSFLVDFLQKKGYEVWGTVRDEDSENSQLYHCDDVILRKADLLDDDNVWFRILGECNPHEIYNLAAISHVGISFSKPIQSFEANCIGSLRVLCQAKKICPKAKFYHASSSEIFGSSPSPQNEKTEFHPISPYGVAKMAAHWNVIQAREIDGFFACNGILFNHEGERRSENFVTKKITKSIARIKRGEQEFIEMGNLDSRRDWGYAKDFVESMWLMLQQDKPDDFVISTGESHSVREFIFESFKCAGIEVKSNEKNGLEEEIIRTDNGKVVVKINSNFYRPVDVSTLVGDFSKAKEVLKWEPKISFYDLVRIMVEHDLKEEN